MKTLMLLMLLALSGCASQATFDEDAAITDRDCAIKNTSPYMRASYEA